jgi:hypothetical protein
MPKNSPTHKLYEKLKQKGHSPASAARIAQAQTGKSLATGRRPKNKR